MIIHMQLTLMPPPHLAVQGADAVKVQRIAHVRAAPASLEAALRELLNDEVIRALVDGGACINVVVQKHNPRTHESLLGTMGRGR